jgi:hypothetical protein
MWFPLHAPEKVGTEGMSFYLLNIFICIFGDLFYDGDEQISDDFFIPSRLLVLYIQQVNHR